jgi:1,4-dihydroxy-2-naphthoate octaprenyltransferase
MTWLAYSLGALGAMNSRDFDPVLYWLGYACLFFGEAATVFVNEWFDYESDRRNRQAGPFNGGSRVLVNTELGFRELRFGIWAALAAAMVCAGLLLDRVSDGFSSTILLLLLLILGLGYTAPPLKLSWRGLGEINVGFTHSFAVILCGYVFQGGSWNDPFPWLVSLPLFVAVLPAILLSGVPDMEADRQAGKQTLPVRLGLKRTRWLVLALIVAAPLAVLLLKDLPTLRGALDGMLPWILPHGLLLAAFVHRELHHRQEVGRIDGLMLVSLSYIVWFGFIPAWNLL